MLTVEKIGGTSMSALNEVMDYIPESTGGKMNYNMSFSQMTQLAKQEISKITSVSLVEMRKQVTIIKYNSNSIVTKRKRLVK